MSEAEPLTVEQFREAFPTFTEEAYPDTAVSIQLTFANKFFSSRRWGDETIRDHVMGLYAAHYLSAYGSTAAGGTSSSGGGSPTLGIVASKSVDGASISYDTSSTAWNDAGFWNATPYGRELWYLMRIFGAGAIQL